MTICLKCGRDISRCACSAKEVKEYMEQLKASKEETQQVLDDYQDLGKEYYKLECELEKAEEVIDLMAEKLVEAHGWFYSEFDNYSKEDWKEYFYKKVSNNK